MGFTADTMYNHVKYLDDLSPGAICDFNCEDTHKLDLFARACFKNEVTLEEMRDMSCDGLKITRFVRKAFPLDPTIYCTTWDKIEGKDEDTISRRLHHD